MLGAVAPEDAPPEALVLGPAMLETGVVGTKAAAREAKTLVVVEAALLRAREVGAEAPEVLPRVDHLTVRRTRLPASESSLSPRK